MTSCVFFGYSDIGYQALETLISMGQKIDAVFTHEDGDENIWFRSVAELATKNNIPTHTYTPTLDALQSYNADIVLCAYYRNILPTAWLLNRPLGAYNIHGSLLPKCRGAQPTNWAVICGDKQSGITLHAMHTDLDAGDIINQKPVDIGYNDTAYDVMQSIIPLTADILNESWDALLHGDAIRTPQDHTQATIYPRRTPKDGEINPMATAQNVHNLIRGVSHPYPGAFFFVGGKKITIWKSEMADADETAITGTFVSEGQHPTLKCSTGAVAILSATFDDGTDARSTLSAGTTLDRF